jgi:SAM-dependent methyltransferase
MDSPPWAYEDLARSVLRGAGSALDMGTGGGEMLLGLRDALPRDTVATEGWAPNIPVAQRSLNPQGIDVVEYDAESGQPAMPFPDGRFDVVLNRHEAYRATEVFRVLRPGGRLLTQQVDGREFEETQRLFGGRTSYSHITPAYLREEAERAGFVVEGA